MYAPIPPEVQEELNRLNTAVDAAIQEREKWLDEKMVELAPLKVGDPIYNVRTGEELGTVHRLYRYWTGQNKLHDRHLSWDYSYETGRNCLDNTSRQTGVKFGTREEAITYQKDRLSELENPTPKIDIRQFMQPNGDFDFVGMLFGKKPDTEGEK